MTESKVSFITTINKDAEKNATGITVPPAIISKLSTSKKPRVKVTLKGYTYTTTVAVMGGLFLISLSAAHRNAANVKPGEELEVTLELDTAPQVLDVPDDLKQALTAANLWEKFEILAFSKRKEFVRQVNDAKTQETRERRISSIITKV